MKKELIYNRIMSKVAHVVKNALDESEDWSDDVKTKFKPKKDIFAKGSAKEIADYLLSKSGEAKAMQRLNFYINRAGSSLTNKAALEGAKKILMKKKKEVKESQEPIVAPLNLGTANEYKATNRVTKILIDYILHKGDNVDNTSICAGKYNYLRLENCDQFGTAISIDYTAWMTDYELGDNGDRWTAPTGDQVTDADFDMTTVEVESDFYPDQYPFKNYDYKLVFDEDQYAAVKKAVVERFGIDLESFEDEIEDREQDIIDYNNDYDPDEF